MLKIPTTVGLLAVAALTQVSCRSEPSAEPAGDTVAAAQAPSAMTVSPTGIGPVRAGMTLAEARTALGDSLPASDSLEAGCYHVVLSGVPGRALGMIVGGRLARVEVRDTLVATDRGARVGSSEARIDSLYAGRVQIEPHKYTDGHYLVVTPATPADSAYRLIFETDGQRVTEYRAGLLPAVRWVEGCS